MRYLTIEQRESLERALKGRVLVLRSEIAAVLRQQDTTMHLANRFDETDDEAVADLELSLDIASVQRDLDELRRAYEALGRIHSPEYGVCSDCEADIPFARLQAEPAALRCVACQSSYEHSHAGGMHSSI